MRSEGGWYEEDCQWAIAAVVHPIGFQRKCPAEDRPDRTEWDIANETLRNWYPDEYEQWAGVHLVKGESFIRDQRNHEADNVDNFVTTSAWGSWAPWVPKGMVGVSAVRKSDGARKEFLVPADEYNERAAGVGFVIDLSRHQETKVELP